ncbi:hypothetical protein SAMN06265375_101707 [Muriicola jejuensis]|nr:hypothetical protein SAMN06265375_101707 [Muriicola jejuensis]
MKRQYHEEEDYFLQPIKRKIQSQNFYRDKKIGIGHDKITPLI